MASPPPAEEAGRGNEGSGRRARASSQAACLACRSRQRPRRVPAFLCQCQPEGQGPGCPGVREGLLRVTLELAVGAARERPPELGMWGFLGGCGLSHCQPWGRA